MSVNRFVGSAGARIGAVALAATTASLAVASTGGPRYLFWAAVVSGVATFIFLVHSFAPLFKAWMRFAEGLQAVVIRTLFTVCYLVIVPVFTAVLRRRDPLRRRHKARESSWVLRPDTVDASSLERMG